MKDDAIRQSMASIENRIRHVYNQGYEDGRKSVQKVGKWIFGETMGHSWMKCSECCKSQDGQTLCFTYCPNCGAKMEGAEE